MISNTVKSDKSRTVGKHPIQNHRVVRAVAGKNFSRGGNFLSVTKLTGMNGFCYDLLMKPLEMAALARARAELVSPLSGRTLEIGCGTGANFHLYRQPQWVTAVEPDKSMFKRALHIRPSGLSLHPCGAEQLSLEGNQFDHVVSTLVFCSLKDPVASAQEICRVCKPGARLHLLEHLRGVGVAGLLHDFCTPFWSRLAGGCHLNRETLSMLQSMGFQVEELRVVFSFLGTPFVLSRLRVPVNQAPR